MKKKVSYFYVVDEDGDQMSLPTTSYKEAKKDLKEIIKNSSGYHRYAIDEIDLINKENEEVIVIDYENKCVDFKIIEGERQ